MRLAFLGSPEAAVPTLQALVRGGHDVVAVVTGSDRRRGRGTRVSPTPVKAAAVELGLDVHDDLAAVASSGAELGVVVAYGRIIPASVLAAVPMLNLHFSLLPRWRGAAPVERAILAGDARTGVSVMDVAAELDTGDVHAAAEVPIDDSVTASELTRRLALLGADLMLEVLDAPLRRAVAQREEGVTYAHKVTAADRHLDWNRPADELRRVVRIGGAWTTFRGARLKVQRADAAAPTTDRDRTTGTVHDGVVTCGAGTALRLVEVQPEGRAPMSAAAWANGARPDGERLGDDV